MKYNTPEMKERNKWVCECFFEKHMSVKEICADLEERGERLKPRTIYFILNEREKEPKVAPDLPCMRHSSEFPGSGCGASCYHSSYCKIHISNKNKED